MISAEQIAIVINDVRAVIQTAHSHVLLAVQRNPVPEQFLLHFARGIRCDCNFIFARTQSEDAKATDSPENCASANQVRRGRKVLVALGNLPSSKSIRSGIVRMSVRSAMPYFFFLFSNTGVKESRHPSFDTNPFQTNRSPSFGCRPL